jgi:hypothetical protein
VQKKGTVGRDFLSHLVVQNPRLLVVIWSIGNDTEFLCRCQRFWLHDEKTQEQVSLPWRTSLAGVVWPMSDPVVRDHFRSAIDFIDDQENS